MERRHNHSTWLVQASQATIGYLARRPLLSLVLVLALGFYATQVPLVQPETTQRQPPPPPPPPHHRHHPPSPPVITVLERNNLALENDEGWTKSVALDERTTFWSGRQPATWEDLRVGQRVFVHDEPVPGGKRVAREVHILPPGPPPPPPRGMMGPMTIVALLGIAAYLVYKRTRCCPTPFAPAASKEPEDTQA